MKIDEVFLGVQGEGKRAGRATLFVRMHGCSRGCSFCDTPQEGGCYTEIDDREVDERDGFEKIACLEPRTMVQGSPTRFSPLDVCITGGEPLEQLRSTACIIRALRLSPILLGGTGGRILLNTAMSPHGEVGGERSSMLIGAMRLIPHPNRPIISYSPKDYLQGNTDYLLNCIHSWHTVLGLTSAELEVKLLVHDARHACCLLREMVKSHESTDRYNGSVFVVYPDRVSLVIQPITPPGFDGSQRSSLDWVFTEPSAVQHIKAEAGKLGIWDVMFLPQVHAMTCGRTPGRGV